jgi:hypothetical protein
MPEDRTIQLKKLFELVWERPVSQVSREFGLSDKWLTRICKQNGIPTPPRGYWAKLDAGGAPRKPELPSNIADPDQVVAIPYGYKQDASVSAFRKDRRQIEKELDDPALPELDDFFHAAIEAWLDRSGQTVDACSLSKQKTEVRKPFSELSQIDLLRLRVTSAFLATVEGRGAKLINAEAWGRFIIVMGDAKLVVRILHKMTPRSFEGIDVNDWTVWPEHHVNGHNPTRDLKLSIEGKCINKVEFVLSEKAVARGGLKKLIACVLAAEKAAVRLEADRTTWFESYEEERLRQERSLAESKLEKTRRMKFNRFAEDWEQENRLKCFLRAIEAEVSRRQSKGETVDNFLDWIAWAKSSLAESDTLEKLNQYPFLCQDRRTTETAASFACRSKHFQCQRFLMPEYCQRFCSSS